MGERFVPDGPRGPAEAVGGQERPGEQPEGAGVAGPREGGGGGRGVQRGEDRRQPAGRGREGRLDDGPAAGEPGDGGLQGQPGRPVQLPAGDDGGGDREQDPGGDGGAGAGAAGQRLVRGGRRSASDGRDEHEAGGEGQFEQGGDEGPAAGRPEAGQAQGEGGGAGGGERGGGVPRAEGGDGGGRGGDEEHRIDQGGGGPPPGEEEPVPGPVPREVGGRAERGEVLEDPHGGRQDERGAERGAGESCRSCHSHGFDTHGRDRPGQAVPDIRGRGAAGRSAWCAPAGPRHPHGRTLRSLPCPYIGAESGGLPRC